MESERFESASDLRFRESWYVRITYLGAKLSLSCWLLNLMSEGKSKIMLRPSSMIGLWQKEQRTLQGSWCSVDLEDGSYHSRSWWPFLKLMSSLWKMAAHWKGAAEAVVSTLVQGITRITRLKLSRLTMLGLACSAVAQLAIQWLLSAELVLDFAAVACGFVAGLEVLIGFVNLVGSLGLPVIEASLGLLGLLFGRHLCGVGASGCCSGLVGAVWCYWSGEGAGGGVRVLGGGAVAVAEDGAACSLAERGNRTRNVGGGCESLDGEAEGFGSVDGRVVESCSAKQDWCCPREGAKAGHIMGGLVYAAVVTTSQRPCSSDARCSGSQ